MFAVSAFDHVLDSNHWHFFETREIEAHLPWGLTKYKILMVVAALLIILIYVPIAQRARSGKPPRGAFWNAFESILTFIRNELAKPYLGHDADRYVHYLWTVFLFVLFCNLFGLIPFLGSPTASFTVTCALALCTFLFIHGSAVVRMSSGHDTKSHDPHLDAPFPMNLINRVRTLLGRVLVGFWHYIKSYYPHLDVPFPMNILIGVLVAILEIFGNFIKAFVLSVRLFANIFAGHVVLAFILIFIVDVSNYGIFMRVGVTFSSVVGVTLLSILELFVGFLQAYVFTFLTALFLGSALHPQH